MRWLRFLVPIAMLNAMFAITLALAGERSPLDLVYALGKIWLLGLFFWGAAHLVVWSLDWARKSR
jgi:hypothetical protein